MSRRFALLWIAVAVGCGEPRRLPSGADAGADAGASHEDGGSTDGGAGRDAGVSDAGSAPDAGPLPEITFVVSVPSGTPAFEPVHVAGNQPALGSWSGAGLVLRRQADGRWTGAARFAVGTELEFKITRGTWETVEKDAAGGEIANRAHRVTGDARLELAVAAWRDAPRVTGNVESLGVITSTNVAPRPVLVYLPPGYETETTRRYGVLYFHDGQNVFDRRTAFGGVEWGVDETAESLIRAGAMDPVIIVAVGNTPDRIDEYTPVASPGHGGGRADAYARFLVEELKPLIDSRYRTDPSPDRTGVAGSSLGGLVSMYLGLTRSGTFRRLGVISPSVWWANRDIVSRVAALPAKLPLRIWEDIGTAEGGSETVEDARALRDALAARGWREGDDLSYHEFPGARHDEASWAARVGDVLRYLYPPR